MAELQIKLEGVCLSRGGVEILHDIAWEVLAGQRWVLLGPNGSGKTSMLEVITGYEWPNVGRVTLLDERLGEVDIHTHRRRIGLASTGIDHFIKKHQTALQIVLSGFFDSTGLFDSPTTRQIHTAQTMLDMLGCGYLASRRFSLLSLGEQRKVLIARSLVYSPEMLILDEPCAGLDIAAREFVLKTIAELAGNGHSAALSSIIYVTHHIDEILPCFTHILAIKSGGIVAAGPIRQTLTSDLMTELYGIPIEVGYFGGRYTARVR
ncbi:MAG TPA: ATP-binding cassette domain-containing protein [Phycisphaerae bacterium]|nr:ATP-binding cassette domain-containing protein [Phycisphaerae bacterium]